MTRPAPTAGVRWDSGRFCGIESRAWAIAGHLMRPMSCSTMMRMAMSIKDRTVADLQPTNAGGATALSRTWSSKKADPERIPAGNERGNACHG